MNASRIVNQLLETDEEQFLDRYSDDIANERMAGLRAFCNEVQDLLTVVDDGNAERSPATERADDMDGREESRWMFLWDRLAETRKNFGL